MSWLGLVVVLIGLGGAAILQLRGPGPNGIHAIGALPERFAVCGRNFHGPGEVTPAADIRARGSDLVLVDPAPLAPCPDGTYVRLGDVAVIHTVVYVRVAEDGYVAYELLGGP